MATAGAPGGSIPNTAAAGPGTNNTPSSIAIVDAGLCSKVVQQLPQLMNFFSNTKNALAGIATRGDANASAIANLQRTQADFNNETNFFSFWFRQLSPELDAAGVSLSQANDALADMNTDTPSEASKPGIPSALAALPGPNAGEITLYWVSPTYIGSSAIDSYTVNWSGATTSGTATVKADGTSGGKKFAVKTVGDDFGENEFHDMYGANLFSYTKTGASTDGPYQFEICAVNMSGMGGNPLAGQFSAKTRPVASVAELPNITIVEVLPGHQFNLISWRNPSVPQPDGSNMPWTGIQKWTIDGAVILTKDVGAACSVAQIPVPDGTLASYSKTYNISYTTPGLPNTDVPPVLVPVDKVGTPYIGRAYEKGKVPPPRFTVSTTVSGDDVILRFNFSMVDFYSPDEITYTPTLKDINASNAVIALPAGFTFVKTASSGDNSISNRAQLVVTLGITQLNGSDLRGKTFSITATATITSMVEPEGGGPAEPTPVSSLDSLPVGPIMIPALPLP